ncbi:long-chain-fatty-acid--CoA ligase [Corynebacterium sp. MNWGS58]|uniref:long-chain-fatty-acid--CoA ligase n=1 Tax=Corynebacterium sp. 102791.4 TaxID=3104612 RepID=UPI003514B9F6
MTASDTKAWLQHYGDIPEKPEYEHKTLLSLYDNNLTNNHHRQATYFFGESMTYSELDKNVRAVAAGLKAFGVGPGDRVAVLLPNCPQHVIAFYAIQKIGATVVEHNPLYTAHELEGLFQDHGARIAICWDKAAPMLEQVRSKTPLETIISVNMINAMPRTKQLALRYLPLPSIREKRKQLSQFAPNTISFESLASEAFGGDGREIRTPDCVTSDTTALILYTSGTTGAPKGAELTQGNISANIAQILAFFPTLGRNPDERVLGALPMFHVYGLTLIAGLAVSLGGEMVLVPKPEIPLLMDVIKNRKPSWMPGVPTLYSKVMEAAEKQDIDLKGIANSISGAAPLPEATVEKWEQRTGGLLVEGYGLTETSPVLCCNPHSENRRPGYIGIPFPDTEVRIANPDNLEETMPDGEEGELLGRGPQVFKGYLHNEEATENAFHDGWFRTGDMAVMEEDGFVRIVSRIKEMIITGGFNVYPGEVEDCLGQHPDVEECAVVGRPRKDGSEDVVACVVLRAGAALDPDGLKDYCRERLTAYKVPRTFYHFEELATDQIGKLRRREVQADLLDMLGLVPKEKDDATDADEADGSDDSDNSGKAKPLDEQPDHQESDIAGVEVDDLDDAQPDEDAVAAADDGAEDADKN